MDKGSEILGPKDPSRLDAICRAMAEHSPEPLVAIEVSTHIARYLNPAFCRLVGKAESEMIGKSFFDLVTDTRSNGFLELLTRVLETGLPEHLFDQKHNDHNPEYWTYSAWLAFDSDNRHVGFIIHITDSTKTATMRSLSREMNEALLLSSIKQNELIERAENLNEELTRATQAKNQFLATMSHEIRTPLNAIVGFAEILSSTEVPAEKRKGFGHYIERNTRQLLRLIDDVIDLSKIEAGKLEIEHTPVNLYELFSDTFTIMKKLADSKAIVLSMKIDDEVPKVIMSDPVRFKQILTNVIDNAIKFTSVGSVKISVGIGLNDKLLRIRVSDTGSGISPEESSRLFHPFTQGDSTTTRNFGGSGLGLDLSRRLATALGGDVKLLESTKGKGSTFEIAVLMITAKFENLKDSDIEVEEKTARSLNDVHVLLAEDAPDNQFLVTTYLTEAGAFVDIAENGEIAISMAGSKPYDIILMDIQMPKVDGYQATSSIRAEGYTKPIIALTAHAMQGEMERCQRAGCDRYMTKPINRIKLINTIHQMVKSQLRASPLQWDNHLS